MKNVSNKNKISSHRWVKAKNKNQESIFKKMLKYMFSHRNHKLKYQLIKKKMKICQINKYKFQMDKLKQKDNVIKIIKSIQKARSQKNKLKMHKSILCQKGMRLLLEN